MAKLILFKDPVPYKEIKEAFIKVINEYLPKTKFDMEGEAVAWTKYLNYFIKHEGSYITDRIADVRFKEVSTYLEFITIPNRPFFHLYDGIDRAQRDVRIFDEYPIMGIFIVPEMKDPNHDPNKPYPTEEGLVRFIKSVVEKNHAPKKSKKAPKVWLGVFYFNTYELF